MLAFGEREMDRQQAFALRNIQRLIRIVRLRRATVELTRKMPANEKPVLNPAVASLMQLTETMLAGVRNPMREQNLSRLLSDAHRITREAALRMPGNATVDALRVMVAQLEVVSQ